MLFILSEESLSSDIHQLTVDSHVTTYSAPHGCGRLSLILFVDDDLLIFTNGSKKSLTNLMGFFSHYENMYGKKINQSKSIFL